MRKRAKTRNKNIDIRDLARNIDANISKGEEVAVHISYSKPEGRGMGKDILFMYEALNEKAVDLTYYDEGNKDEDYITDSENPSRKGVSILLNMLGENSEVTFMKIKDSQSEAGIYIKNPSTKPRPVYETKTSSLEDSVTPQKKFRNLSDPVEIKVLSSLKNLHPSPPILAALTKSRIKNNTMSLYGELIMKRVEEEFGPIIEEIVGEEVTYEVDSSLIKELPIDFNKL